MRWPTLRISITSMMSPPNATARLVVDTDVASFVFKWHTDFAPHYVGIIRGFLSWFSRP